MTTTTVEKDASTAAEMAGDQPLPSKSVHSEAIYRAKAATEKEHRMSLIEGIRTYPKAIGWSFLISLCIVMEAFDQVLLNTFCTGAIPCRKLLLYLFLEDGLPQFQQHFGQKQSDGSYQIPAAWQAGLGNGRQAAQFVGLLLNGWISERFGYRYTVIVCLVFMAAWTAIYYTANTLTHLLVAGILRIGILPCSSPRVLDDLGQLLLGSWPGHWRG